MLDIFIEHIQRDSIMAFNLFPPGQKVKTQASDRATLEAISKSQAIIEFNLDGTVLAANPNFLQVLGYDLSEIVGQHHRLFVDAVYAKSPEYQMFWDRLRRGEFDAAQYKRIAKGGREVWIQASYNPVFDANGNPVKIVRGGSVCLNRLLGVAKWISALVMLLPGLASAR
jgi:methyl-accepting chemotaxis protein